MKRTAREIEVTPSELSNKNISVKIGASENRDAPETVYIYTSFWVKPRWREDDIEKHFKTILLESLRSFYKPGSGGKIMDTIITSEVFMNEKDNIYIVNVPENFNYNEKSNFISLELYLHTSNIDPEINLPLNHKKNTRLYDELLGVANSLGELINKLGEIYEVKKKLKKAAI